MRTEISNAVNFLTNLIRSKNPNPTQLSTFRDALTSRFAASFTDHWFPERPLRGNAYRCVRIVSNRMDRLIAAAGADAGLSEAYLLAAFPQELCVWIDPDEVSYRIGEDGSVGIVYSVLDNVNEAERSDDELEGCSSSSSSSYRFSSSSPSLSSVSSSASSSSRMNRDTSESPSSLRVSPDTVNQAYLIQARVQ
jgi:protein Tob/BTG